MHVSSHLDMWNHPICPYFPIIFSHLYPFYALFGGATSRGSQISYAKWCRDDIRSILGLFWVKIFKKKTRRRLFWPFWSFELLFCKKNSSQVGKFTTIFHETLYPIINFSKIDNFSPSFFSFHFHFSFPSFLSRFLLLFLKRKTAK